MALPNFEERLECYQLHLLLDSLAFNAWQEDQENLEITVKRMKVVIDGKEMR